MIWGPIFEGPARPGWVQPAGHPSIRTPKITFSNFPSTHAQYYDARGGPRAKTHASSAIYTQGLNVDDGDLL